MILYLIIFSCLAFLIGEVALFVLLAKSLGGLKVLLWFFLSVLVGLAIFLINNKRTLGPLLIHLKDELTPPVPILCGVFNIMGAFLLVLPGLLTDFLGLIVILKPFQLFIIHTLKIKVSDEYWKGLKAKLKAGLLKKKRV